jgi:CrcB protein
MSEHRGPSRAAGVSAAGRGDAPPAVRVPRWQHAVRDLLVLYTLIALGTVIGGVLRALVSLWTFALPDPGLPWATLFVNVAGSFLIGFYAALTGPSGRLPAGPRQQQFVMSGICGGFTTFSVFSLETFRLAQAAHWQAAGLNVGGSVLACLAAVWVGHVFAARFERTTARSPTSCSA